MNAFEKFVLSLDPVTAIGHLLACLRSGDSDNEAWKFMQKYVGRNWSCDPKGSPFLINGAIKNAKAGKVSEEVFEITICSQCYEYSGGIEEMNYVSAGDESWSVCPGCRSVEGDTKTIFVNANGDEVPEPKDKAK